MLYNLLALIFQMWQWFQKLELWHIHIFQVITYNSLEWKYNYTSVVYYQKDSWIQTSPPILHVFESIMCCTHRLLVLEIYDITSPSEKIIEWMWRFTNRFHAVEYPHTLIKNVMMNWTLQIHWAFCVFYIRTMAEDHLDQEPTLLLRPLST